jgi:hypothetical protein
MIKFSEVKIGQKFVFGFDKSVKNDSYYYSYEKVGDKEVKCLTAPKTEKDSVGRIFQFRIMEELCNILEEPQKEEKMSVSVVCNGVDVGIAYDKNTLYSLLNYCYLVMYNDDNSAWSFKSVSLLSKGEWKSYSYVEYSISKILDIYFPE